MSEVEVSLFLLGLGWSSSLTEWMIISHKGYPVFVLLCDAGVEWSSEKAIHTSPVNFVVCKKLDENKIRDIEIWHKTKKY